ncbi:MAG: hypothetical protein ABI459_03955 [Deltaproteobacteria bacterium]
MKINITDVAILSALWRFVRGDTPADQFENWVYVSSNLEAALGSETYLDIISVDYTHPQRVADLKAQLDKALVPPNPCLCHTVRSGGCVRFGLWTVDDFDITENAVDGKWWLHRLSCRVCHTGWLVAADERIYDLWLAFREPITPPPDILTYRGLLAAARNTGECVGYVDPLHSWEIPAAIQDLARETPGIALSEIVDLLPIDRHVAHKHAVKVMAEHGVNITFDA